MPEKDLSAEAQTFSVAQDHNKRLHKENKDLGNPDSNEVSDRTTKPSEEPEFHSWYLRLCPKLVYTRSSQSSTLSLSLPLPSFCLYSHFIVV